MSPSQSQTRTRRSGRRPPRATTARGPRAGLAISLVLHAGLAAATYWTWHNIVAESDITHAVPVDLITIAQQTNVAAQAPPPDKIEIPKPVIEPPEPPQLAQIEPAPEPPLPNIKIKPDQKDDEQDKPKKPTNQDFTALLNKLTATPPPVKNAKTSPRTVQGVGAATLATASLVDALQSQIARCWSPNVAAPNPNDMVVDFNLRLNRDGTVSSAQLAPGSVTRAYANPYTQASAEAASRAIYQCQAYRLPPERYAEWSDINFHFDPRRMMGQ